MQVSMTRSRSVSEELTRNATGGIGLGVSVSLLWDVVEKLKVMFPEENPVQVEDFYNQGSYVTVTYNTITTSYLCSVFIKPTTMEAQQKNPTLLTPGSASYANMRLVLDQNSVPHYHDSSRLVKGVDSPNHFCSHAWQYKFVELVDAITEFVKDTEREGVKDAKGDPFTSENMFFWIDNFAVDENFSSDKQQDWWKNVFQEAISKIGSTVLILHPWDEPMPLKRSWCLWEIFSTRLKGVGLHVRMSRAQRETFIQALTTRFEAVLESLSRIDVRNASAWSDSDRRMINQSVEDGVGFEDLNESVKEGIRNWLCAEGVEVIKHQREELIAANVTTMPEELLFCQIRVGDLLLSLGRLTESENQLNQALADLEAQYGPWPDSRAPIVVVCIASMARLQAKQRHFQQAAELFSFSLIIGKDISLTDPSFAATYARTAVAHVVMLQSQGLTDLALSHIEKLAGFCSKSSLPIDDPVVIDVLNNWARLLKLKGRYREALEQLKILDERCQKFLGPSHPSSVECSSNMASALKNLAKSEQDKAVQAQMLEEVNQLLIQVYTAKRETFGRGHRDTSKALHDLAKFLFDQGKVQIARQRCEEALENLNRAAANGGSADFEIVADINLTMCKTYMAENMYSAAEAMMHQVNTLFMQNLGPTKAKTLNALGELGYLKTLTGHMDEGRDMMRLALDGLINTCRLDRNSNWVSKLEERLAATPTMLQNLRGSNEQSSKRVLVVDCGSNETKACLLTQLNGRPSLAEIGTKFEPMMEFLREKRNLFVQHLNQRALAADVDTIYIGMTGWFREADEEDRKMAKQVLDAGKADPAARWVLQELDIAPEQESLYEALAVEYAARHNNMPPIDLLIGSGGGSVQIATQLSTKQRSLFSIPRGFRDGQQEFMREGLPAISKLEAEWEECLTKFRHTNTNFVVPSKANIVCISSAYYAAEAAGIEEDLRIDHVLSTFKTFKAKIVDTIRKREGQLPDKTEAMNIVNLTMQIAILSHIGPSHSTVRFRRNWLVQDMPFRTTWSMGWYLETFCRELRAPEEPDGSQIRIEGPDEQDQTPQTRPKLRGSGHQRKWWLCWK